MLGLVLMVLKYLGVAPVTEWSWWWVLSPFPMAMVWWWYADKSGYTRRKAAERDEQRKADRYNESRKRLGLPPKVNKR
ncbi:MAG: hypothetical protein RL758_1163 [Pseudomonadota bacterium]|jgi:small Trp-rich protein